MYIECHYAELGEVTVAKIQGRIEEWGTRRRAILATGDNRWPDWRRLGLHECWIKLGEDSVEAIRQAFLADEARIAYGPPERPTERIVEIEVKSKLTGETPVRISFNDGFTALIGAVVRARALSSNICALGSDAQRATSMLRMLPGAGPATARSSSSTTR